MPRPLTQPGLRGPGQERWPEQARAIGRNFVLYPDEVKIFKFVSEPDGAGATKSSWEETGSVRGRIDPVGTQGTDPTARGDQIKEMLTHRVTVDPAVDIDTNDRVEVQDRMWVITNILERTDKFVHRFEVKVV